MFRRVVVVLLTVSLSILIGAARAGAGPGVDPGSPTGAAIVAVGPTDVAWQDWPERYGAPASLIAVP